MPQPSESASLDAMFEVLCHSYRRRILLAVADQNPRSEDELVSQSFLPGDGDDTELEQAALKLHHVHLPKLADTGYIDWTRETETIRRGANFDEIVPLLHSMSRQTDESPSD